MEFELIPLTGSTRREGESDDSRLESYALTDQCSNGPDLETNGEKSSTNWSWDWIWLDDGVLEFSQHDEKTLKRLIRAIAEYTVFFIVVCFRGVGQVFFVPSFIAGIFFLVAAYVESSHLATMSIIGTIFGLI